jgi:hypothetical protein
MFGLECSNKNKIKRLETIGLHEEAKSAGFIWKTKKNQAELVTALLKAKQPSSGPDYWVLRKVRRSRSEASSDDFEAKTFRLPLSLS